MVYTGYGAAIGYGLVLVAHAPAGEVRGPGFFERTTAGDSIKRQRRVRLPAVTKTDDVAYSGVTQQVRLVGRRAGWTRYCTCLAGPRRPGAG
jgi:hypothetical protein